ncbi:hypothetical protein Vadar_021534 [Vaccinium darrowii]|uniref:Uncharacterized protein n=1 Tax=Vaccinium darrowii TaxID=229202 RepID=A0ACB7YX65_9ERIC|nr:hypothetical protein Vadar_021534 [Vaccinium darrowii]
MQIWYKKARFDCITSFFVCCWIMLSPTNSGFGKTGPCIQISVSAESLFWHAERLFFLNGEQDLSAFLLVDLEIIKYPDYTSV